MRVAIYDRATNTQQGSTVFVNQSDLLPDKRAFQVVAKRLGTAASLVAGTKYYFAISSGAVADLYGSWRVQAASADPTLDGVVDNPPPSTAGNASFGGQTNAYTRSSPSAGTATEYKEVDACVVVHTIPDTPSGFTAVAGPTPTDTSNPCSPKPIRDVVNLVNIGWTSTTLNQTGEGGGFGYYQIQRDDGNDLGWQDIAIITDETCNQAQDDEAVTNQSAYPIYRMRVVRADGAPSDWTATATAPITMLDRGGFAYTTNYYPERGLWYAHANPTNYSFPSSPIDHEMYLRDGAVRFSELEDRLTAVTVDVMAQFIDIAARCVDFSEVSGEAAFKPLLILATISQDPPSGYKKLALPYLCVRSAAGERWFAALSIPEGTREEPQGVHMLPGVTIKQMTRVPSPIDQTCTPGGSGSGGWTPGS